MIKDIFLTRFDNFTDKNLFKGLRPPMIDKSLFFAGGDVWKRIRRLMEPAFTPAKLKLMCPYIQRCSAILTDNLERIARGDQLVHVQDVYGSFTMDVIAGTAFGLETNSQTQEGEPFVTHNKALFGTIARQSNTVFMLYLMNSFPYLTTILGKLGVSFAFFKSVHGQFFINAVSQMIEDRKSQGPQMSQKRTDVLQALLDVEADPSMVADQANPIDDIAPHSRLTKEEMVGQGFILLTTAYQTVSTTLQYLTFNLVHKPDVQEKIYQEICNKIGDAELTYENVARLSYLHAASLETLRMFPTAPVIDRKAKETVTVQGVTIPAGCGVFVPVHAIMHDPEFFRHPDQFLPERHLEEKGAALDPMLQELAFGYGPRQCIGMRLALLELKFAAVTILRKFRFLKSPDTPEKITLGAAFLFPVPDLPIKVKVELRHP